MDRINSRQKGARAEREFSTKLKAYGHEARRGQQFRGGNDSPDVVSNLPFHFEVKRVEQFSLYPAMDQAIRDAAHGKTPVVAHRRNGKPWVVIMSLDDFMELVEGKNEQPREIRRIRRVS